MRWELTPKKLAAWLAGLILVAGLTGFLFVQLGVYNVSALRQHTAPVYWLLDYALAKSVKRRSDAATVPDLSDKRLILSGFKRYVDHCEQCHGGPGIAPQDFALGMMPVPNNLVATARHMPPEDIFWIVRNGLKMTGMPAWNFQLSESQHWEIVAFVKSLTELNPNTYRQLRAALQEPSNNRTKAALAARADVHSPPDPEQGKIALQAYACTACHVIPGVVGANRHIGPSLASFAEQKLLAGSLANRFDNLVLWLQHPTQVKPSTAMPDLGVSESHARDMAAYLFPAPPVRLE